MAILSESNNYCRESFANPTFIFRRSLMFKSFAKSFAPQKIRSGTQKNTFVEAHVTLAAFVVNNLYMDLEIDNQSHTHIYIYTLYI
jgi:hypothetical protein